MVPGREAAAMQATLEDLQDELSSEDLPVCGVGVVGVTIRGDGVYLGAEHGTQGGGRLPLDIASPQRVLETKAEDDPRPLYVIPWIPGSEEEDLSALREKLRSQLLSNIGRAPIGEVELTFDDLLDEVSRGVYALWRDRQSLKGQVNTTVGSIVRGLTDGAESATVRAAELVVHLGSEDERRKLMEQIRRNEAPSSVSEGIQLTFDDELPGASDR